MGYFSNGCEGTDYQDNYCMKCQNWKPDEHGVEGCVVWDIHVIFNSDQCRQDEKGKAIAEILQMLIPTTENGLENQQCRMFLKG